MKAFIIRASLGILFLLTNFHLLHSSNGLRLVGRLDNKHGTTSGVSYSGSWGYVAPDGREYAIVGTAQGTAIIEITDTNNIHEVKHIPGLTSIWREMRTHKDRLYVVTEAGGGMQIIDLSKLPTTATLIKSFTYTSGTKNTGRSHSLQIFDGYLYLNGCATWSPTTASRGTLIFSLADKDNPAFVGEYSPNYFHDSYVRGNTFFGAAIYGGGGIYIADITNKAAPIPIGKISYTGSGTHNVWATANGSHLISTDEIGSTAKTLKFWNLQNLPTIPTSPTSTYAFTPLDIEHNVFVRGNFAYTAWYTAGIVATDVRNPALPTTAGWYDTSNDTLYAPGTYNGVWGAYPYFWSGKIIAGDMQNGLYVFLHDSLQARTPTSLISPASDTMTCGNAPIEFKWSRVANPLNDPHTYRMNIKKTGIDTTFQLGSDTTFTLSNPAFLGHGPFRWCVITKDEANAISSQDTFTVVRQDSIALTNHNGGEVLKVWSQSPITWESACVDSIDIAYSTNNGGSWIEVARVGASNVPYLWTVPAAPTTQGRLRLRAVGDFATSDISTSTFTIFNSATLAVLGPNGGEVWKPGYTQTISWSNALVDKLGIDYSIDSGATWTTIVSDTSAAIGSIVWIVPSVDTRLALIRIVDDTNSTVYDESDTTFVISPHSFDVTDSWNLVSLPLAPASPLATTNFPGASSEPFAFSGNYKPVDSVSSGIGYWIKYPTQQTLAIDGALITDDTIPVSAGWNLVGTLSIPIPVTSVIVDPIPTTISNFFEFSPSLGYVVDDTLHPGRGYWVRSSTAANLILSSNFSAQASVSSSAKLLTARARLNFTSANGQNRALLLPEESDGATHQHADLLPPRPPADVFDVRFGSPRMTGRLSSEPLTVYIQAAEFPLTVDLVDDMNGNSSYQLVDVQPDGRRRIYRLTSGRAELQSISGETLLLERFVSSPTPGMFTLEQNFPNPFNPSTEISYGLPEQARVTLKLYTVMGLEIATVVDEVQSAGTHTVVFDGSNLASGIYLYSIKSGAYAETKRMMLLK